MSHSRDASHQRDSASQESSWDTAVRWLLRVPGAATVYSQLTGDEPGGKAEGSYEDAAYAYQRPGRRASDESAPAQAGPGIDRERIIGYTRTGSQSSRRLGSAIATTYNRYAAAAAAAAAAIVQAASARASKDSVGAAPLDGTEEAVLYSSKPASKLDWGYNAVQRALRYARKLQRRRRKRRDRHGGVDGTVTSRSTGGLESRFTGTSGETRSTSMTEDGGASESDNGSGLDGRSSERGRLLRSMPYLGVLAAGHGSSGAGSYRGEIVRTAGEDSYSSPGHSPRKRARGSGSDGSGAEPSERARGGGGTGSGDRRRRPRLASGDDTRDSGKHDDETEGAESVAATVDIQRVLRDLGVDEALLDGDVLAGLRELDREAAAGFGDSDEEYDDCGSDERAGTAEAAGRRRGGGRRGGVSDGEAPRVGGGAAPPAEEDDQAEGDPRIGETVRPTLGVRGSGAPSPASTAPSSATGLTAPMQERKRAESRETGGNSVGTSTRSPSTNGPGQYEHVVTTPTPGRDGAGGAIVVERKAGSSAAGEIQARARQSTAGAPRGIYNPGTRLSQAYVHASSYQYRRRSRSDAIVHHASRRQELATGARAKAQAVMGRDGADVAWALRRRQQEALVQYVHDGQLKTLMDLRAGALADLRRAEAAIETLTAEGPLASAAGVYRPPGQGNSSHGGALRGDLHPGVGSHLPHGSRVTPGTVPQVATEGGQPTGNTQADAAALQMPEYAPFARRGLQSRTGQTVQERRQIAQLHPAGAAGTPAGRGRARTTGCEAAVDGISVAASQAASASAALTSGARAKLPVYAVSGRASTAEHLSSLESSVVGTSEAGSASGSIGRPFGGGSQSASGSSGAELEGAAKNGQAVSATDRTASSRVPTDAAKPAPGSVRNSAVLEVKSATHGGKSPPVTSARKQDLPTEKLMPVSGKHAYLRSRVPPRHPRQSHACPADRWASFADGVLGSASPSLGSRDSSGPHAIMPQAATAGSRGILACGIGIERKAVGGSATAASRAARRAQVLMHRVVPTHLSYITVVIPPPGSPLARRLACGAVDEELFRRVPVPELAKEGRVLSAAEIGNGASDFAEISTDDGPADEVAFERPLSPYSFPGSPTESSQVHARLAMFTDNLIFKARDIVRAELQPLPKCMLHTGGGSKPRLRRTADSEALPPGLRQYMPPIARQEKEYLACSEQKDTQRPRSPRHKPVQQLYYYEAGGDARQQPSRAADEGVAPDTPLSAPFSKLQAQRIKPDSRRNAGDGVEKEKHSDAIPLTHGPGAVQYGVAMDAGCIDGGESDFSFPSMAMQIVGNDVEAPQGGLGAPHESTATSQTGQQSILPADEPTSAQAYRNRLLVAAQEVAAEAVEAGADRGSRSGPVTEDGEASSFLLPAASDAGSGYMASASRGGNQARLSGHYAGSRQGDAVRGRPVLSKHLRVPGLFEGRSVDQPRNSAPVIALTPSGDVEGGRSAVSSALLQAGDGADAGGRSRSRAASALGAEASVVSRAREGDARPLQPLPPPAYQMLQPRSVHDDAMPDSISVAAEKQMRSDQEKQGRQHPKVRFGDSGQGQSSEPRHQQHGGQRRGARAMSERSASLLGVDEEAAPQPRHFGDPSAADRAQASAGQPVPGRPPRPVQPTGGAPDDDRPPAYELDRGNGAQLGPGSAVTSPRTQFGEHLARLQEAEEQRRKRLAELREARRQAAMREPLTVYHLYKMSTLHPRTKDALLVTGSRRGEPIAVASRYREFDMMKSGKRPGGGVAGRRIGEGPLGGISVVGGGGGLLTSGNNGSLRGGSATPRSSSPATGRAVARFRRGSGGSRRHPPMVPVDVRATNILELIDLAAMAQEHRVRSHHITPGPPVRVDRERLGSVTEEGVLAPPSGINATSGETGDMGAQLQQSVREFRGSGVVGAGSTGAPPYWQPDGGNDAQGDSSMRDFEESEARRWEATTRHLMRMAIFSPDDSHPDLQLLCGGHAVVKLQSGYFRSARAALSVPHYGAESRGLSYFEVTFQHAPDGVTRYSRKAVRRYLKHLAREEEENDATGNNSRSQSAAVPAARHPASSGSSSGSANGETGLPVGAAGVVALPSGGPSGLSRTGGFSRQDPLASSSSVASDLSLPLLRDSRHASLLPTPFHEARGVSRPGADEAGDGDQGNKEGGYEEGEEEARHRESMDAIHRYIAGGAGDQQDQDGAFGGMGGRGGMGVESPRDEGRCSPYARVAGRGQGQLGPAADVMPGGAGSSASLPSLLAPGSQQLATGSQRASVASGRGLRDGDSSTARPHTAATTVVSGSVGSLLQPRHGPRPVALGATRTAALRRRLRDGKTSALPRPRVRPPSRIRAGVGLSGAMAPLSGLVGSVSNSIGLCSSGHLVSGGQWLRLPMAGKGFGVGDTVGVMVRWLPSGAGAPWGGGVEEGAASGSWSGDSYVGEGVGPARGGLSAWEACQLTVSVNGRVVGVSGPFVVPRGTDLFPTVSLETEGVRAMGAFSAEDLKHCHRRVMVVAEEPQEGSEESSDEVEERPGGGDGGDSDGSSTLASSTDDEGEAEIRGGSSEAVGLDTGSGSLARSQRQFSRSNRRSSRAGSGAGLRSGYGGVLADWKAPFVRGTKGKAVFALDGSLALGHQDD